MCKWGVCKKIEVTIPEHLSHTGKAFKKIEQIDSCIAEIVDALETKGIMMTGSCCGHGKFNGRISLLDGRELLIIHRKSLDDKHCAYCGALTILNETKDHYLCPNTQCPLKLSI